MQGVLYYVISLHVFNYSATSTFTSLTDEKVSRLNPKLLHFIRASPHCQFVCRTYGKPLDMLSLEIRHFNI